MMQPTKEMYETIPRFLESAKEVKIDSVWNFDVSPIIWPARGQEKLMRQEAPKAFERIETSRAKGKVVVRF